MKKGMFKAIVSLVMIIAMMITPVYAANINDDIVAPCYTHTQSAALTIGFDDNNVIYCGLSVSTYSTGTGTSGLMRLYNASTGALLQTWPVSDYEQPIDVEFTYPGEYGTLYTVTYEGYVYGNNMTAPDWLDLSITDSCVYGK